MQGKGVPGWGVGGPSSGPAREGGELGMWP